MLSRLATLFNVVPQEALLSGARLHGNSPYKRPPAHGSAGMGHRSEIDGFRAIAVLSVVFYHFSVPGFGGGFVGVDIFFVISGFLIGDILWRELTSTGTLSLVNFYARRIRRLAPAYCVMAIATFIATYLILLPFEFREFGKELISSTFYLSNVYFYRQSGYFDTAADEKVLLHTWSLSVEEQFYIFLPLLLLLFRRNRTGAFAALIGIAVVSLGLCIAMTRTSHTAAFFLFPFRAWELLAGVLLAIYGSERAETWRHAQAFSWIGLAMLVAAILFVQPGPFFPGVQVLLPTFGALLILYNGRHDNPVNRVLSSRAPVFVGLISYSLYLWHWPVMTLSRYYRGGPAGAAETIAWLALAFMLAYASWRFVEQPFRRTVNIRLTVLYCAAAAMSACLVLAGSVPYLRNGMPDRFSPAVRAHIDASADFLQDWSRCYVAKSGPLENIEVCPIGPEGPPTFLVWGDSHVRAFQEGLALSAQEHGRPGLMIWRAGCPPLFGIQKQESAATRQQDEDCTAANARMREAIPKLTGIEKLLLIGRWSYYSEGRGTGNDIANVIALSPIAGSGINSSEQHAIFEQAVFATVAELSRSINQVMVLRQVPEIPAYDSRDAARRIAHHRVTPDEAEQVLFTVPISDVVSRTAASERPFKKLAAEGAITWLQSWASFCSDRSCAAVQNGRSLYFDNNHITNAAARGMRQAFEPVMRRTNAKAGDSEARQ